MIVLWGREKNFSRHYFIQIFSEILNRNEEIKSDKGKNDMSQKGFKCDQILNSFSNTQPLSFFEYIFSMKGFNLEEGYPTTKKKKRKRENCQKGFEVFVSFTLPCLWVGAKSSLFAFCPSNNFHSSNWRKICWIMFQLCNVAILDWERVGKKVF